MVLMKIQKLLKIKCDIYLNYQTIRHKIIINKISIPVVASAWCLKRRIACDGCFFIFIFKLL
jgi:hypothetical protein